MVYKRYQYYSKSGISWTSWFPWHGDKYPWQFGHKLRNEYKEEA